MRRKGTKRKGRHGGARAAGGRRGVQGAAANAGRGRASGKTTDEAGSKSGVKARGKGGGDAGRESPRAERGRAGGKARAAASSAAGSSAAASSAAAGADPWGPIAAGFILLALAVRVLVNAFGWVPVHFDEAQYWAWAQTPDWGYFSKPPLIAWTIAATGALLGDSLFAMRLPAALAHALAAWLIFLAGRRLGGGLVGFWAALGYLAAPGVTLSSMLMTTDPLLLLFWAAALYAHLRAREAPTPDAALLWWGALGAAIGAGFLAKYTMVAYPLAALAWALVAGPGRDWRDLRNWRGVALAGAVALAVAAPNLVWQWRHGFVTLRHIAEDADPGRGYLALDEFLRFALGQLAVIGPVFLVAMLAATPAAFRSGARGGDEGLVAWLSLPLLAAFAVLAFLTRAEANWAAPAHVGGALLAAGWLVGRGAFGALRAQIAIGAVAALVLWGLAGLYAGQTERLTWRLDPFRPLRVAGPFCARALDAMAATGAEALLFDSRKRLSECMYIGRLGWDRVAAWNPDGRPDSHHELVASLRPGDSRRFLLAVHAGAPAIAGHFRTAREIESATIATHLDRTVPLSLWVVEGFRGY